MSVSHPAVKAVPAALLSLSTLLALSISLLLTACGGGGGGSTTPVTPTITSVAVVCSPSSINTNQTSTCTPTVSGTGNYSSSVTWSVSPTSIGTVSSAGVFTPAGSGTATITATSTQDSTKSGNATVAVTTPSTITSITVDCSPASILTTQTSTCSATVQGTGSYSSAVTWGATDGTMTSSGVFTPAATGTATITATSTQDTSKSGTASVAVGSATANEWAWVSGSDIVGANGGQPGVYGSLGVASASNVPGGRVGAISWTDSSGDLWLFGGNGYDSTGVWPGGILNDLWEFSPTNREWTWMSGSSTGTKSGSAHGTAGVYGTLGVASSGNVPGGRDAPVSWTDTSGNLWLFGGAGYDSTGTLGDLNDLWKFNPTTKEWTWMGGSDTEGAVGVYGTEGVPSASNVPGARYLSVSWTDKSGNFWLFSDGYANDLWEFNPTTKMWAWMSGSSDTMVNPSAPGVYGIQGVASASNVPGARNSAVSWTDSSGNLWLFGGEGGEGVGGMLNDLWEFSPTTKEWMWVSGSSTGNASGVYGTLGVASTSTVPGARWNPVSWTDSSGNLWLFGGQGLDSTGASGWLNDLWEFSPSTKEWTWMGGSNTTYANAAQTIDKGQPGVYGTEGVPAATNVPGGRYSAVSWTDSSGNFWLFGGAGHDSTAAQIGELNDLWRYQP